MQKNNNLPNYITENRGIQLNSVQVDPKNPGTFKVSEEEGARLRAMAMANANSDMSPEMQAAMGMVESEDYDQKIPKDIHNQICYDEARKNNEKFLEESTKFTDSIVHDNATKEILDEAEATTNLSQFDFGDISDYLKKLEELSFLEAVSYKKKIDSEIARWKSCNSMLKAISDLKLDDNVNRELMKINAMEDYKFNQSLEDFESHYEENLDKLNQIANKLASLINTHKDEMDSTRFLTDEMIHLMQGKLNKLNPNGLNYEYNKSRMETVVYAFERRRDLDFLKNKLQNYLNNSKVNIKRDFRDNSKLINNNGRTRVIQDLVKFFNEDIVYAVFKELMKAFHDDIYATYIMMGFLAKTMNNEKKTSKDVWVKVFALNLSDIYNNIFDIDILSEGESSYMSKVQSTFYNMIKEFLDKEKINVKINNNVTFGLNSSRKKYTRIESIEKSESADNECESHQVVTLAPSEAAEVF